jgi:poly(3-hydroxybutyrate) depolymerase
MRWLLLVAALVACDSNDAATGDANVSTDDGPSTIDASGSSGCGQAGAVTGVVNGTITVGNVERGYIRVVPANYDPARPYPLIFAWHGRTGSGTLARQYFRIEQAAGDAAIFVYPHGLPVTADPNDTGWELTATGRDIALFDALQAEISASYCVGRTYSMGHSFGGYMSNALGCFRGGTASGKVRAIASIAGGGPFGACSGDPISAAIIHGMSDQVVAFSQGQASRDAWRTDAGCETTSMPIDPSPCVAYDGCDNGLVVRFCAHNETTNGGHGWPTFAAPTAWQLFRDSP